MLEWINHYMHMLLSSTLPSVTGSSKQLFPSVFHPLLSVRSPCQRTPSSFLGTASCRWLTGSRITCTWVSGTLWVILYLYSHSWREKIQIAKYGKVILIFRVWFCHFYVFICIFQPIMLQNSLLQITEQWLHKFIYLKKTYKHTIIQNRNIIK